MLQREALWRLVIATKYVSMRGGWSSKEVLGTYGVDVWKHIRRGLFALRWGLGPK
jgi:hypothetical protein